MYLQFSRMNLFETASIKCKSGRRDADISHSFVFVLGNRCFPRLPKLSRVPKPYPRKEMRLTILPARHTPRKPTLTLLNKESPFCQIQRLPSWSFSNYHFSSDSEFAKLFLLFGFEFIIQFASSRFQKKTPTCAFLNNTYLNLNCQKTSCQKTNLNFQLAFWY